MRKLLSLLLVALLVISLSAVVFAASEEPVITLQPQSPNYPEYSVAIYTVKATGTNLHATWYMEWLGETYNLSDAANGFEPWEAFAGEAYGPIQNDANTFSCIFEGIEYDLDGAYIWCVIEDGHYSVASQKARISVGNPNTPPMILDIPAQLTVEQGDYAEIRCIAQAPGGQQLSFLWYETDTGRMEDMRAVNRGVETSDYLICDTGWIGTRYYLCKVETDQGGLAYSSIVSVTVTEKVWLPDPPSIQTNVLPQAEVGTYYSTKLVSTDPNADFSLYYSPGGANDFEKIGMTLARDGTISGTPTVSGSFSFSVCAANAGGEDYMTYELIVKDAPPKPTEVPTEVPTVATEAPTTEAPTTVPEETIPAAPPTETNAAEAPATEPVEEESKGGIPWWSLVLVGLAGMGAGIGAAVILIRKMQK